MTERNVEWEMLGATISQFASVGARPWELRLLALKGRHASLKDMARLAVRHQCDMRAPRLEVRDD